MLFNDHVSDVDTYAKSDPPLFGHLGLALGHSPLHFHRTPDGVDDARELCKEAVASVLYDPAAVLLDLRVDQLAQVGLQPLVGSLLIGAHEARVTRHVGGKNGGQPAFDASRGQSGAPNRNGRLDHRLWLILTVNASAAILFR